MADIHIFSNTKYDAKCSSCKAPMTFAQHVVTHKRIPFNAPIVATRSYIDEQGRAIEVVDSAVTTSHFASCPDAQKFRRKK